MKTGEVTIDILGGKDQIGGNIILMEYNNLRLCLDIGSPLEGGSCMPVNKADLTCHLAKTDYCLISHAHQDHWGHQDLLPESCVIYSSHDTETLIRITRFMTHQPLVRQAWRNFKSWRALHLGEFTITPYLIDHSAYDAHAFLIQVGGISIFYTGDIRFHGRKGKLSKSIAKRLSIDLQGKPVDLLIIEGTNVSGKDFQDGIGKSEEDLTLDFEQVFSSNELPVIVQMSGQNIDRLVTIYKACLKTKRMLILDPYTAFVLARLNNRRIPQLIKDQWGIGVLLPDSITSQRTLGMLTNKVDWMCPFAVNIEDLRTFQSYVLIFRFWIGQELTAKGVLPIGSSFIYSMSSYYLDKIGCQWGDMTNRIENGDLRFYKLHVSGHAYPVDLVNFIGQLNYRFLLPVHTENPAWFILFGEKTISWESEII